MDILIIGEFSGFAKHLKHGFERLGHRVVITLNGDGWKGFKPTGEDIFYRNKAWKIFGYTLRGTGRFDAMIENRRIQRELEKRFPNGPDIIFCINYIFLASNNGQCGVSINYIRKCQKNGAKFIVSECGGSMAARYCNKDYYEMIGRQTKKLDDARYSFMLDNADVIIPTHFGYYSDILSYANYHPYDTSKVIRAIPLPIMVDEKIHYEPCANRKIVIFHGIIHPEKKGTPYIQAAMEKLEKEFPDRVECICKGGMPYDEYVKLFDRMDILIDQCNTREGGWGVNATIGAMKGKCVLVSCGTKNQEHMGIPYIPFIPIKTDSNQIYEVLKDLVTHPNKIDEIKLSSRKFVENYCECSVVAKKYLKSVGVE